MCWKLNPIEYTFMKSWRGYIFAAVCLCVCLYVCLVRLCLWIKFQPNRWTDLDAVFTKWLLTTLAWTLWPYGNWWSWVKGQGHSDVIPMFPHNSLFTYLLCISALLFFIKMKFDMSLGWFVFKFYKNWIGDDIIVTSFKFSPNNCPYLKFYWTYKLHVWCKHSLTLSTSNVKIASDLDKSWRSQVKVKGHIK